MLNYIRMNVNNMYRIVLFLIPFLLLLFLNSCNNAPTEIGTEFLQDTIAISNISNTDSVIVDVKSYYYNSIQERNTGALLVGNTNDFKAVGMIRFNIPIGKTDIKEEDITECTIHFSFNNYKLGNNTFAFDVREVHSEWDIETSVDDVLDGSLFENNSIANWSGDIQPDDSTFNIPLPFSAKLVVEWFNKINDGYNIQDTIWGIAIVPNEACNVLASFKALSNETAATKGTYISIKYKTNDTADSIDSLIIYTAEEVSFIKDKNENIDTNKINLQGGVRIHTKFSFDLTEIPTLAAINNAELILRLDDNNSEIVPPDTLFLNYFDDRHERIGISMIRIVGLYDKENKCYTFKNELSNAFNYFIRKNKGLGDLVLTYRNTDRENNKIERLNFLYDPNHKNKHITIKIFYSKMG